MTLEAECALSYYAEAAQIKPEHGVSLVQHTQSKRFFVKKLLSAYNKEVYLYLQAHPVANMPRIEALFEDNGTLTVIEEYIAGDTLEALLEKGALDEASVIKYTHALCGILDDLHSAKPSVLHRDIKPSNVMLSADGVIKLLDMNAAKIYTGDGGKDTVIMGTAGYAAPEQYGFKASGVQTDIYALGVLMNVLLTGALPSEKAASGKLAPIIEKCTKMEPQQRFKSVKQLDAALLAAAPSACQNGAAGGDICAGSWQRYLPPGFRTKNPFHMMIAVCGYYLIGYLAFTLALAGVNGSMLIIYRAIVFIAMLAALFFAADYLGIQARWPLTKSANVLLRTLGILATCAGIFVLAIALVTVIDSLSGLFR